MGEGCQKRAFFIYFQYCFCIKVRGVENNLSPSMRSIPFKIRTSFDLDSDAVDSDVVDSELVDSELVEIWWFSSKSCGYPSQLYKVLIFLTSNLDKPPSTLSLKVAKFQKEFWISFYFPKMNKISVCQPFCLLYNTSWKVSNSVQFVDVGTKSK